MRRSAVIASIGSAILGISTLGITQAQGDSTCGGSAHCYGYMAWNVRTVYGVSEYLTTRCLNVPNPGSDFATSEMWLNMTGGVRWVEEGTAYGYPQGYSLYNYWADRNLNGYYEYDQGSANLNQSYSDQISPDSFSGGSWYIYRDGANVGRSLSNPGPAVQMIAGMETTTLSAVDNGIGEDLQWEDTGSVWHTGWSSPGFASAYTGGRFPVSADIPYSLVYNLGGCTAAAVAPPTQSFSNSISDILTRSKQLASANGDSSVAKIEHVLTGGSQAASLPALHLDAVVSPASLRIVEVTGSFTGYTAKVPPGDVRPTGSTLIMAFDGSTGKLDDWSIQNSHVDLSGLGAVTTAG
jgi:hypothetical protein